MSGKIRRALRRTEVPFIATVLLAAVAWGTNYVVDRVVDTPFVQYSISKSDITIEGEAPVKQITISLANLSVNTLFEGTFFYIRKVSPDTDLVFLEFPEKNLRNRVESLSHVWLAHDPEACPKGIVNWDFNGVEYCVPNLPPSGAVNLIAYYRGTDEPIFQGRARRPMKLQEPSFLTWIVRYDVEVIGGAIAIWLTLSLLLLFRGGGNPQLGSQQGSSGSTQKSSVVKPPPRKDH